MKHAEEFGLQAENCRFDATKVVKRSRKVAEQLATASAPDEEEQDHGVRRHGEARRRSGKLAVTRTARAATTLTAKNIILATGARARALPGLEPDGKLVWTYKEAMVPPDMPKSLLVDRLGRDRHRVREFLPHPRRRGDGGRGADRVLPVEDAEISAFAKKPFEKQGMKIMTGATVKKLKKGADNVTATHRGGRQDEEITVDA